MFADPMLQPTDWKNRSVVARLNTTIEAAKALYASVAFWTIKPGYLSTKLEALLAAPQSFCCVDLRGRTNVDRLLAFHRLGATQLRLFIKRLAKSSDLGLDKHLLHTKLLLFDLPNGEAELWVGSHNFSAYALGGGNREASMVLNIAQSSPLYQQTKAYLLAIKAECYPFDPALLAQYKQLQGVDTKPDELETYVLPVFWNSALPGFNGKLANQTMLLLSNHEVASKRLNNVFTATQPLLVWAYDLATGRVSLWQASVQNVARIDATASSSDIRFGYRLLAVLENDEQLPYLAPKTVETGQREIRNFGHVANVWLYEEVTDTMMIAPPASPETKAGWQVDKKATEKLHQSLARAEWAESERWPAELNPLRTGMQQEGASPGSWLELLHNSPLNRQKKRALRAPVTPRLPVVETPVFDQPQPIEDDPLAVLYRLSERDRQSLRVRYEQPLRERYFGEQPAQFKLSLSVPALPRALLTKLLLKYQLLMQ